jgi:UDP-N-acetylglucosamine/UDP-N-acetylgalactosamine diphosphorylase
MENIDLALLARLYAQAESGETSCLPPSETIRPPLVVPMADSPQAREERRRAKRLGGRALEAGQVAVVLVAGGQGTRLGHEGPKGTFAIGAISGKSLFQFHAEKVLAIGRRYGARLPLYVMTSPDNDEATRRFFADHAFFGLHRDQVVFFQQGMMPVLDRQTGMPLLSDKHRLATSPDGHGGVVKALADGGHLSDLRRRGVEYIFYYQVDNPLVKVAEPAMLGYHIQAGAEMSLKVVRKLDPGEKMGVVVEVDGRTRLIEYSDLPTEVAQRRLADGSLEIWAGSIAVHVFNTTFLERLSGDGLNLPYHRAIKSVPHLDQAGRRVEPAVPNAIKFEMFVFDALPLADKALVMETDRRQEFEPLKNATGDCSPDSVRRAMSNLFAGWLEEAGLQVPYRPDGSVAVPIEIGPLVALDAEELGERLLCRDPVEGPLLLDEPSERTGSKHEHYPIQGQE